MKKLIAGSFVVCMFIMFSGFSIAEDTKIVVTEDIIVTDCPDCYGTLQNTYKTEYCVGVKCRTRTLYRCNLDRSHEYWIYKD